MMTDIALGFLGFFLLTGCLILIFDSGKGLAGSESHTDYVNNLFSTIGSVLMILILAIPAIAFFSEN